MSSSIYIKEKARLINLEAYKRFINTANIQPLFSTSFPSSITINHPGKLSSYSNKLFPPIPSEKDLSLQPPRYFFKGKEENDKRKNPPPIHYLLQETTERLKKEEDRTILSFINKNLKCQGTLKSNNTSLFLEIDNRYIISLFHLLKEKNLAIPPYFDTFGMPYGAHISIILPSEYQNGTFYKIKEIGQDFSFRVKALYSSPSNNWDEVERVWFLEVVSRELENLRERYHLSPTPRGHNFHITLGIKLKGHTKKNFPPMRINPSYLPA